MNARNLLGMPVVVTSQGELIGEVCDLVLKRSLKVEGLVVKGRAHRGWLSARTSLLVRIRFW